MFLLSQYMELRISEKGEPLTIHKSEAVLVRLQQEYSKTSSEAHCI